MKPVTEERRMSDTDRIKELEAENQILRSLIADVIHSTGDDPEIMAASRAEWAARALEAEDQLAKAVDIAQKAIEQLRPHGADVRRELAAVRKKLGG
jgi:hypothetical protein